MDLLSTYREFMSRLDIAAKPERAIERGFYVPRSNFSMKEVTTRLLLEPHSTHLLVGGLGSGKTTELLQTREDLERNPDTTALYIDVSEHHDLNEMKPGVLILLVGLGLFHLLSPDKQQQMPLSHYVKSDEPYLDRHQGILKPPGPQLPGVTEIAAEIRGLHNQLPTRHIIAIFDSLDRVHDPQLLARVIQEDIQALKQIYIGVVLVGPLSTLYGAQRPLIQRFDQYSILPDVDVIKDEQGRDFLFRVLRARVSAELLPDEVCQRLVTLSGGILRDLLKLAKQAGQRAFMADAPQITLQHVEAVAEVEGRGLLFGMDKESLEKLRALAQGADFELVTEDDLRLLETRRVIQYQESDGRVRYVLHPVLHLLLNKTGAR